MTGFSRRALLRSGLALGTGVFASGVLPPLRQDVSAAESAQATVPLRLAESPGSPVGLRLSLAEVREAG